MDGHARKCVERHYEMANRKSGANFTKFQVLAWMAINSNRKNLNQSEKYHNFAHKIVFKMLALGTKWKTRHSVVCQQTCKSSHKMDSGTRQTTSKIDFIHSSHKWQPTILSMWVTQQTTVDWVYFKTRTLLATVRTRNQLRGESYVTSEAEHLSPSVGCARKQTSPSHSSTES